MLLSEPLRPARDTNLQLFLDADYLAYEIGSLSEYSTFPTEFPLKKGEYERVCIDEHRDIWKWIEPVGLVDWKIDNAINLLKDRFETEALHVYLTGSGNFRERVAKTRPYKANRKAAKPHYWQYIRDQLIGRHNATIIDGIEADDEVSIMQMNTIVPHVVCCNDKDLRNTPGYLYLPDKRKQLLRIHPSYAQFHFLQQMVVGDRVDNIPGLPRRGIAWFNSKANSVDNLADLREIIYNEYIKKDHTGDLLLEQGRLLHMMRHDNDVWSPHTDYTEDAPCANKLIAPAEHLRSPYDIVEEEAA